MRLIAINDGQKMRPIAKSHAKGQKTGGGSRRGVPNQLSGDVKAMILAALDAAGGADYLLRQSVQNPVAFMALLGKLLPTQVTGKDGGAILNAFDPTTLTDAELAARIDQLRRTAVVYVMRRAGHRGGMSAAGSRFRRIARGRWGNC